jgi:hypothetical protein
MHPGFPFPLFTGGIAPPLWSNSDLRPCPLGFPGKDPLCKRPWYFWNYSGLIPSINVNTDHLCSVFSFLPSFSFSPPPSFLLPSLPLLPSSFSPSLPSYPFWCYWGLNSGLWDPLVQLLQVTAGLVSHQVLISSLPPFPSTPYPCSKIHLLNKTQTRSLRIWSHLYSSISHHSKQLHRFFSASELPTLSPDEALCPAGPSNTPSSMQSPLFL